MHGDIIAMRMEESHLIERLKAVREEIAEYEARVAAQEASIEGPSGEV